MKKSGCLVLVLVLIGSVFMSCASVGGTNSDNSLLIILNENDDGNKNDAFVYYRYRGDNFSIKINTMEKYQKINYFKAGSYEIKSRESVYIESDSIAKKSPFSVKLTLQKDSITIFPYKTVVTLKDKKQYVSFVKLNESDYKNCENYIADQERYKGLRVIR